MNGDWKSRLRLRLEDFVDTFVVEGAKQEDVIAAITDELAELRVAYEHDPDPADDASEVIDEPANDWPGAERPL